MILADTTVIVDYLRGKDVKLQKLMTKVQVAVCGVVRAEILYGARDAAHRAKLIGQLAGFQSLPIPELLWDTVGDNLAMLRRTGLTIPLPDVTIATLGIHENIEVWARDKHYHDMQAVLPLLKLYQEPP